MAESEPSLLPAQRVVRLAKRSRRALVRLSEEAALLDEICRAAVEDGGYRFAWVGLAEHDTPRRVRPVAQAGESAGYLESAVILWDDSPEGRGPTGTAVRTGVPQWTRDVATDPLMTPWRELLLARSFRSSIALPLSAAGGVLGALTIYADTPDAFDAEEVEILSELAGDLAFGLDTLRTRQAHRMMALAVEQSPAVVVITDLEGRIQYVNPRFTELTGYTLDEVRGRNPRILKSGVTPPEEYARLWRTVTSGGRWSGEFHQRCKDGRTYIERAEILPMLGPSGQLVGYLKVAEDISARAALEEQLRQAQKMEAVGRLAGGIAHDFNNVLTVIQGFTELARLQVPQGDPLRADLEQVLDAAGRAATLTRQLLAFSRQRVLVRAEIDVAAVARDAAPMLRRLAGEDIAFDIDVPDAALVVGAEPGNVEQILMNLVVNARDAMPNGGTLSLAVGTVASVDRPTVLAAPAPGPYVQVEVRDTGCGMDEATVARIFEPFFTTKPAGKGTGLGLSTVYGIVKQGKGALDVSSAPGVGTAIRVYLPLSRDCLAPVAVPVAHSARDVRGSETVLVVDDDGGVGQFAARTLRRAGFTVLVADNPGEALLAVEQRQGKVDLLLTDVVMSYMTGPELWRRLAQAKPDLQCLFMSGYPDDVLTEKSLDASAVRLIRKPFTGDELVRRVRQMLDEA
ncbi:histidine kinase [Luteitalea sp. TBR-22]|uniref:GAF domain-containing protein n=1 Tax=Luteitalea sp. TBR-22 TaxID=2802971 RepID=UPI001AF2B8E8|nr:GAF domain-containing protein [Luteitalea sp. TBR-22]BCS32464.1 histidine kinase [Luteitalea sp. TBR-22]